MQRNPEQQIVMIQLDIEKAYYHEHTKCGLGRSAQMMGLRAMSYEFGARSDEARNSRSCERHESMKTEMKKETIWTKREY